jgi:hypothetical protein
MSAGEGGGGSDVGLAWAAKYAEERSGTMVSSDEESSRDMSLEVGEVGTVSSSICPPKTLSISAPLVKSSSSFSRGIFSSRALSTLIGSYHQLCP